MSLRIEITVRGRLGATLQAAALPGFRAVLVPRHDVVAVSVETMEELLGLLRSLEESDSPVDRITRSVA